jgi:hypothetical protein
MKDFELKDLEQTLLMEEKSFGIISKDTYTPFEPGDSDWIEYTLAIVNLYPRSIFPTIGGDLTVRRNSKGNVFDTSICMSNGSHKILRLTIEDVLKIMDIFQKNNLELIFDFRQDYRSFDMEKYINRIARLTE